MSLRVWPVTACAIADLLLPKVVGDSSFLTARARLLPQGGRQLTTQTQTQTVTSTSSEIREIVNFAHTRNSAKTEMLTTFLFL